MALPMVGSGTVTVLRARGSEVEVRTSAFISFGRAFELDIVSAGRSVVPLKKEMRNVVKQNDTFLEYRSALILACLPRGCSPPSQLRSNWGLLEDEMSSVALNLNLRGIRQPVKVNDTIPFLANAV